MLLALLVFYVVSHRSVCVSQCCLCLRIVNYWLPLQFIIYYTIQCFFSISVIDAKNIIPLDANGKTIIYILTLLEFEIDLAICMHFINATTTGLCLVIIIIRIVLLLCCPNGWLIGLQLTWREQYFSYSHTENKSTIHNSDYNIDVVNQCCFECHTEKCRC
jgi:hypothetical protein